MTIPKSKWFSFNRKTFTSKAQPHTLETAWEKTLEKWELIVKGYNPGHPSGTCGLCNFHFSCKSCPVKDYTGKTLCADTPYEIWCETGTLKAAKNVLAFLKELKGSSKIRRKVK